MQVPPFGAMTVPFVQVPPVIENMPEPTVVVTTLGFAVRVIGPAVEPVAVLEMVMVPEMGLSLCAAGWVRLRDVGEFANVPLVTLNVTLFVDPFVPVSVRVWLPDVDAAIVSVAVTEVAETELILPVTPLPPVIPVTPPRSVPMNVTV